MLMSTEIVITCKLMEAESSFARRESDQSNLFEKAAKFIRGVFLSDSHQVMHRFRQLRQEFRQTNNYTSPLYMHNLIFLATYKYN